MSIKKLSSKPDSEHCATSSSCRKSLGTISFPKSTILLLSNSIDEGDLV